LGFAASGDLAFAVPGAVLESVGLLAVVPVAVLVDAAADDALAALVAGDAAVVGVAAAC
jgi:hypothetical protein